MYVYSYICSNIFYSYTIHDTPSDMYVIAEIKVVTYKTKIKAK